jgi:hypothetical protein
MGVNRKAAQFSQLQRQLESLPSYSLASSALPYDEIERARTSEDSWNSLARLGRAEEARERERDLHVAAGRAVAHSGGVRGGNRSSPSEEHARILRALESDASDEERPSKSDGRQRWSHRLLGRVGALVAGGARKPVAGAGGSLGARTAGRVVAVGTPVRSASSSRKRGVKKRSGGGVREDDVSELDIVLPAKVIAVFAVAYEGLEVPMLWPTGKKPGDVLRVSVEYLFDPSRLAKLDADLVDRSGGL